VKDAGEGFIHGGTYPLNSKTLCKGDLTGLEIDEKKNTMSPWFFSRSSYLSLILMTSYFQCQWTPSDPQCFRNQRATESVQAILSE